MDDEERYADAIGEIGITGPVVRIDLVRLSATEKGDSKQPKPVFRQVPEAGVPKSANFK